MLNKLLYKQLEQNNISVATFEEHLKNYISGFPYLKIVDAATPNRGIHILSQSQINESIGLAESYRGDLCKFVPASGAASRMFKDLYEANDILSENKELNLNSGAKIFLDNFREFPFCTDKELLDYVLYNKGLNYGSLPKGLIKFHKYSSYSRTAFEEHLVEGALYAKNSNKIVNISFTVSPEHIADFKQLYFKVRDNYQKTYDCVYNVNFSTQSPSTDIIAVDENNSPFIIENGKYLFRPGGHGALLNNLNKIKSNIIIIKNIDNVVKENHLDDTVKWKKILIGRAVSLQQQIFSYIGLLNNNEVTCDLNSLKPIIKFLNDEFCVAMPDSILSLPTGKLKRILMTKLNRPLRICGMVKNQGEPGGGPFIIRNNDGSTSLQILESAQINMSDENSALAVSHSTHFNPVDIVCAVNNYKGHKFNLQKFSDPATGFISSKSYQGRKLKAQELPGLWNGSMSDWNTQFVEVPISTFNPVKTVVDLLRPMHRD